MPVVGTRKSAELDKINRGYASDSMHPLAEQFTDIVTGALNENGLDIYSEPSKFFMHDSTKDSLRRMFVENSYDPEDPKYKNHPEACMEQDEMMNALFENDCEAIMENAPLGSFNPTIGISSDAQEPACKLRIRQVPADGCYPVPEVHSDDGDSYAC